MPQSAKWDCRNITVTGDCVEAGKQCTEDVELWLRNPVECIAELIGNTTFDGSISYVPEHVYTSSQRHSRIYDEMWTSDWWWEVQVRLTSNESSHVNPEYRRKSKLVVLFAL